MKCLLLPTYSSYFYHCCTHRQRKKNQVVIECVKRLVVLSSNKLRAGIEHVARSCCSPERVPSYKSFFASRRRLASLFQCICQDTRRDNPLDVPCSGSLVFVYGPAGKGRTSQSPSLIIRNRSKFQASPGFQERQTFMYGHLDVSNHSTFPPPAASLLGTLRAASAVSVRSAEGSTKRPDSRP